MRQFKIFLISLFACGILSLSACNKEPADIAEMPTDYDLKSAVAELPTTSELNSDVKEKQNRLQDELYKAIVLNNMETVNQLISQGADVNYNYEYQYINGTHLAEGLENFSADELVYSDVEGGDCSEITLLIDACDRGNPELVRALLHAGANIEERDVYGHTPLMHASRWGDTEIASLLLAEGADINAKSSQGTALMIAAYEDNIAISKKRKEIVSLLLQAGADVNATDDQGATALTNAKLNNYEDIIPLLLEAGAKEGSHVKKEASALKYRIDVELKEPPIDFSSYKGTLPLDEEGNPILWSVLIKEENKNKAREYQKRIGAGKKITPQELHDALLGACRHKNQYAVSVLLDAGANMSEEEWSKVIREKVMYTDNPVEESPEDINETLVLLLAAGAEADGSSLVEASQCGFSKAVKTLLATGNIEKEYISKALFEAIEENVYWPENQIEIVQALLEAGADPNVTDEHGYSALKAAENNSKIVQLLKQAGAKEQTI